MSDVRDQSVAYMRLRDIRQRAGLSLDDLALLTGVSPATLGRAERGLTELSPAHRVAVMNALQLRCESARQVVELAP
jgi:transcriptional regulator with XRE-family HTH domain